MGGINIDSLTDCAHKRPLGGSLVGNLLESVKQQRMMRYYEVTPRFNSLVDNLGSDIKTEHRARTLVHNGCGAQLPAGVVPLLLK